MGDKPVNCFGGHSARSERLMCGFRHHLHRELEDGATFHLDERGAGDGAVGDMGRHAENVTVTTVSVQMGRHDARNARRRQYDGSGAVAEQHTGAAVVPVDDPGVDFGADHECITCHARRDHPVRDGERIDEPAADGLHVESGATG